MMNKTDDMFGSLARFTLVLLVLLALLLTRSKAHGQNAA